MCVMRIEYATNLIEWVASKEVYLRSMVEEIGWWEVLAAARCKVHENGYVLGLSDKILIYSEELIIDTFNV